ncbi:uncharacterized protein DUF3291 [Nitrospirillum amazonense]|uniref:Uncharacterized protein DUF3291 n=1 Tax=Nitrospirillum amazonense TaxID=28077 RepID=A0A560FG76_9PROT|nr:DUF3291 domain-containing protein [Nitrospirillum amazonense]TWB20613.1 uncharacterized protein DUF3291 [Nitrospirillum amazonense]
MEAGGETGAVAGGWQLAQMNVGTALYAMDDPRIADFVNQLDEINTLAEGSPGFVWRLQSDSGNATDILVSDNPRFLVNMSVWASAEALFDYVYKSAHRTVMARRREWFERPIDMYQVLWWVPAGHRPTPQEGLERLAHLERHGATPHAFTFKQKYPYPAAPPAAPEDMAPEPHCVGWE